MLLLLLLLLNLEKERHILIQDWIFILMIVVEYGIWNMEVVVGT